MKKTSVLAWVLVVVMAIVLPDVTPAIMLAGIIYANEKFENKIKTKKNGTKKS